MEATACVVHAPGAAFKIEPILLETPRPDEVLVRIKGVGVCHTDIAFQSGGLPFPMPAVFGHEGSGIVEQVGDAVDDLAPGDAVVLSFRACGGCVQCLADAPAYCEYFGLLNFIGCRPDGSPTISQKTGTLGGAFFGQSSFATYALAHRGNVIKVAANLPIELLGPLGCGIQTGAGAVMQSMACGAGSSILIMGGGSVGLSAVLGAVVQGCSQIILLEPHPARRDLARELGATHVIDPKAGPFQPAVMALAPKGVNFVLDTTAVSELIETAIACLATRGVCGLVGVPKQMDALAGGPQGLLVGGGRSIRGIMEGDSNPQIFIPHLLDLFQAGKFPFDRLITTYPMHQINEAIADQHAGHCVKPVLLT